MAVDYNLFFESKLDAQGGNPTMNLKDLINYLICGK